LHGKEEGPGPPTGNFAESDRKLYPSELFPVAFFKTSASARFVKTVKNWPSFR